MTDPHCDPFLRFRLWYAVRHEASVKWQGTFRVAPSRWILYNCAI
jgi:hypothetical protein